MLVRSTWFTVVFALAATVTACDGCDKKKEATSDAGGTTTAATDAGAPPAASASAVNADAGAPAHAMSNCPTAVAGASVAIKDVTGGVEVTITGKDEAVTAAIRERAKTLSTLDRTSVDGGVRHDHSGSGGGVTGRCTIILRGTDLAISDVPNGTQVVVKAKDPKELDWVRRETRERDSEAKTAGAETAGSQRMAHCPSSVEGAKTSLKDTTDGVLVSVTGPAEKVAEIRARAKHVAEVAAKPEPARVQHTGQGTGGGGLGRCPIVVEGDTAVQVKEIEGGIEARVSTKKDVAALQKEAKLRAENFSAK